MEKCDVLIAGAGPVGLTLALALAQQGISVRIIDKSRHYSVYSKALTLQPRSLELLDILGVSKILVAQGACMFADNIYKNKKLFTKIRYDLIESAFPYLIHLEQGGIEKILDETLLKNYGVLTEREVTLINCKQNENFVTSSIKHENGQIEDVVSSYLVGSDGHSSVVRDLIGAQLKKEIRDNYYIMADTKIKNFDLNKNERHAFILKELMAAILPMRNDYYRIVILRDKSFSDKSATLKDFTDGSISLEVFEEILNKIGFSEVILYDPRWLTRFSPKQGIVEKYQEGRIFLAGDSAHVQTPTGARGLNTGIQDAYNLAWKLGLVIKKLSKQRLLSSYHTDRYPVALELFKYNNERESFLKNNILSRTLIKTKIYFLKIKKFNIKYAENGSELKVNYRNRPYIQLLNIKKSILGPIFNRNHFIGNVIPGDRAPNISLASVDGKLYKNLFELLKINRHLLLVICNNFIKKVQLDLILKDIQVIFEKYDQIIDAHLIFNERLPYVISLPIVSCWVDLKKKLYNDIFKNKPLAYCVVRPDGHIAHYNTLDISETESFLYELEKAPFLKELVNSN